MLPSVSLKMAMKQTAVSTFEMIGIPRSFTLATAVEKSSTPNIAPLPG